MVNHASDIKKSTIKERTKSSYTIESRASQTWPTPVEVKDVMSVDSFPIYYNYYFSD